VVSGTTVKRLVPPVVITVPAKGDQVTGGVRFVANSTWSNHDEVGQKRFIGLFPPLHLITGDGATAKAVRVQELRPFG